MTGLAVAGRRRLLRDAGPLRHPRGPGHEEALAVDRVLPVQRGCPAGRVSLNANSIAGGDFALLFYLERLHQTRLLLPTVFAFLAVREGCAPFCAPAAVFDSTFAGGRAVYPNRSPGAPGCRVLERVAAANVAERRCRKSRSTCSLAKVIALARPSSMSLRDSGESAEVVGDYHNGPLSVHHPVRDFWRDWLCLAYGRRAFGSLTRITCSVILPITTSIPFCLPTLSPRSSSSSPSSASFDCGFAHVPGGDRLKHQPQRRGGQTGSGASAQDRLQPL